MSSQQQDNIVGLFVYKCKECGEVLETFHSYKAEPPKTCPKCKKDTLEREYGSNAVLRMAGHLYKDKNSPIYKDLQIKRKKYF